MISVPWFLLTPLLLYSLVDVEYESAFLCEGAWLLNSSLRRLAEALMLVFPLLPPPLSLLDTERRAVARHSGGTKVLIFYLVDVVKAFNAI